MAVSVHTKRRLLSCVFRLVLLFQTILSRIAWALGPVCVVVAIGLIAWVIFVYFFGILPYFIENGYAVSVLLHFVTAVWFCINLPFNYFMCIFTNPGRGPQKGQGNTLQMQMMDTTFNPTQDQELLSKMNDFRYCEVCDCRKPIRSHHCTVCERCTLRMDHHCPWMANCIGHFNYKYFVLFLFYMAAACFYVFAICAAPTDYGGVPHRTYVPYFGTHVISFIMLLCLSVGCAVGGMFLWHVFLIATQQTTIEFYENQVNKYQARKNGTHFRNPFDVGLHKNWDAVFGNNSLWYKWLLPSTKPPPGDGFTFWMVDNSPSIEDTIHSV